MSQSWANTAIDNELSILKNVPEGTNINKPGNDIFVSLLKIASIVRGGHAPEHDTLSGIKKSMCAFTWIPQKEIDYQWGRAMKIAKPRHPSQPNRLPKPVQEKQCTDLHTEKTQYQITEYDLTTYKTRVLRDVSPKIAAKGHELAALIKSYVEYGEIPQGSNLAISTVDVWSKSQKADLLLRFPRYTEALKDCVMVACSLLNGGLSDYKKTGQFWVIISLKFDDFAPP